MESDKALSRQRIELLRRLRGGRPDGAAPGIPRRPAGAAVPATALQESLWFIDRIGGPDGNASYNLPLALRLRGPLNVDAIVDGLNTIVARHEALRTAFVEKEGVPFQVVHPAQPLDVPVHEPFPGRDQERALGRSIRDAVQVPFDFGTPPLFRASIHRVSDADHVLLLTFHHIVADGLSMTVFLDELAELYRARREGRRPALPELGVQFADYAAWQHGRLAGAAYARQSEYWMSRLAGAPALLDLPTDLPRPAVQSYRGEELRFSLEPELVEGLRTLAQAERVTTFMLMLAALQVVLARHSGQDDIVIGCPAGGRTRPELEPLIGLFLNTVALRGDVSGDPTFRDHLRRARETTLAALAHQAFPFHHLVRQLHPQRSLGHTPFVQVMLDVLEGGNPAVDLPGIDTEVVRVDGGEAKFDLTLDVEDSPAGIAGTFGFRTDLFARSTIERIAHHLEATLRAAVADPAARLSEITFIDVRERDLVLREWNSTGLPPDRRCVHELIEESAARTPDAVAATFAGATLTYRELRTRANRLAHLLVARGVGPDVRVGVCLDRSLDLVVAVLAVLKAGGAFVPMDPEHPAARLAFMAADADAAVVISTSDLAPRLGDLAGHAALVRLDTDAAIIASQPGDPVRPGADTTPANLAYVEYTSGSTGPPKAAANTHAGIVNHLAWVQDVYRLTPGDRVIQKTPLSFDDSVRELLWPLIVGARIVVAGPGIHRDPTALTRLIDRAAVTVLHVVPSLLQAMLEDSPSGSRCPSLRLVMCGGEPLTVALQQRFFDRFDVELVNHYGPTEAAVDVTRWRCRRADASRVPIGVPGANTRIYLLDASGEPVPVGLPGELFIAGAQVGRGYLNRPGQTAAAFVPDPYGDVPGARMYRTGDVARWRADGVLEYVGRNDDQVKLRGYRIEPAEIEGALRSRPGLRDAVVTVREDSPGDRRLVAYCVPADGRSEGPPGEPPNGPADGRSDGPVDWAGVREHLAARLPRYMIPATFVELPVLPLTRSGKVDRRALPAPAPAEAGEATRYVAPRTPTEKAVAESWSAVFDRARVGARDDFFDLGGHSLLAARVASRLRDSLRLEVPVNLLFLAPTVEQLAARIDRLPRDEPAAAAGAITPIDRRRYRVPRSAPADPGTPSQRIG